MKAKIGPLVENVTEAGLACVLTMVQGNLIVLSVSHWIIASRTGLVAGVIATVALLLAKTERRWLVAVVLGVATTVVDYVVHPGGFGPAWAEAAVTGLAAAALSLLVGTLVRRLRPEPDAAEASAPTT